MKCLKMLGLLVVAAVAVMGFASPASASTALTSPTGTFFHGTFHADSGTTELHIPVTVTCHKSTIHGHVVDVFVIDITKQTFTDCTGNHVTVEEVGPLLLKATTLYSTGLKISIQVTSLGLTCVFTTSETEIGTVTGGTTAQLDIDSAKIPRTGGSIFCGSSGEWTGSYSVDSPDTLLVDHS